MARRTGKPRHDLGDAVRWAGRVAFIVAGAVSLGWAVSLVVYMVARTAGDAVASDAAAVLSTVGGVLAGAVATYLGNSSERRDPTSRSRSGDPHPGDTPNVDTGPVSGVPSSTDTLDGR